MRDFVISCYNEHAVKVSDYSSCSGATSADDPASGNRSVACFYRANLPAKQREFLVTVTWSKSQLLDRGFSVAVDENPSPAQHRHRPHRIEGGAAQPFRKKRGSRSYFSGDSLVEVYWDIASARYDSGPEPVGGFYLAVAVDGELALRLGDLGMAQPLTNKWQLPVDGGEAAAEFSMISRREKIMAGSRGVYATKTKFGEGGRDHEIVIQCDTGESELRVSVDRRKVVHVRRLRWNFRGNQTIFVDGLPVDVMWDVHDWWFGDAAPGGPAGAASFLFRARTALENRLWLVAEEEQEQAANKKTSGKSGFTLLIHAFKTIDRLD